MTDDNWFERVSTGAESSNYTRYEISSAFSNERDNGKGRRIGTEEKGRKETTKGEKSGVLDCVKFHSISTHFGVHACTKRAVAQGGDARHRRAGGCNFVTRGERGVAQKFRASHFYAAPLLCSPVCALYLSLFYFCFRRGGMCGLMRLPTRALYIDDDECIPRARVVCTLRTHARMRARARARYAKPAAVFG